MDQGNVDQYPGHRESWETGFDMEQGMDVPQDRLTKLEILQRRGATRRELRERGMTADDAMLNEIFSGRVDLDETVLEQNTYKLPAGAVNLKWWAGENQDKTQMRKIRRNPIDVTTGELDLIKLSPDGNLVVARYFTFLRDTAGTLWPCFFDKDDNGVVTFIYRCPVESIKGLLEEAESIESERKKVLSQTMRNGGEYYKNGEYSLQKTERGWHFNFSYGDAFLDKDFNVYSGGMARKRPDPGEGFDTYVELDASSGAMDMVEPVLDEFVAAIREEGAIKIQGET